MTSKISSLKKYRYCWLFTSADRFAGWIDQASFENGTLRIAFLPLVRVEPDDTHMEWHAIRRIDSYVFTFEKCRIASLTDRRRLIFKSAEPDLLEAILSYDKLDEERIETLITESGYLPH